MFTEEAFGLPSKRRFGRMQSKVSYAYTMRAAAPLLNWGGAHGAFLYGLAREYGRGARARGGESALQSWMVSLLEGGHHLTSVNDNRTVNIICE